jgi:glyoxylase-like metal-dependent hydrolase (beta-lactamase superfamily II)
MLKVKIFTFNPFAENTYVVYDETKECAIIDPGCMDKREQEELENFILNYGLKPVYLLNTHCHLDHVYGNAFTVRTWSLELYAHKLEEQNIRTAAVASDLYGIQAPEPFEIKYYLNHGDEIAFGNSRLKVLFCPGHAAGHVVFYSEKDNVIIGGDVLFRDSIGRVDLPGGDYATLVNSIRNQLFVLPDDIVVYPGHGPQTTLGYEKKYNVFLKELAWS